MTTVTSIQTVKFSHTFPPQEERTKPIKTCFIALRSVRWIACDDELKGLGSFMSFYLLKGRKPRQMAQHFLRNQNILLWPRMRAQCVLSSWEECPWLFKRFVINVFVKWIIFFIFICFSNEKIWFIHISFLWTFFLRVFCTFYSFHAFLYFVVVLSPYNLLKALIKPYFFVLPRWSIISNQTTGLASYLSIPIWLR